MLPSFLERPDSGFRNVNGASREGGEWKLASKTPGWDDFFSPGLLQCPQIYPQAWEASRQTSLGSTCLRRLWPLDWELGWWCFRSFLRSWATLPVHLWLWRAAVSQPRTVRREHREWIWSTWQPKLRCIWAITYGIFDECGASQRWSLDIRCKRMKGRAQITFLSQTCREHQYSLAVRGQLFYWN